MNDKGNNIIPFPSKQTVEKWTPEEYDLSSTYHIINIVAEEMEELGYETDDLQAQKDMTVLANMLYASMQRDNADHILHFVLDECNEMIESAKEYMRNLEQQNNEIDDEDPSNDNNRL